MVLAPQAIPEGAVVRVHPAVALSSVLAFSRDGRRVVCRTADLDLCVLDAATGKLVFEAAGTGSLAPGDRLLDHSPLPEGLHEICVSDLSGEFGRAGRGAVFRWQGKAQVRALALSEDGLFLAAGSDNSICVWDLQAGKPIRVLPDLKEGAHAVAFSPNGLILASAGNDGTVSLWDLAEAERLRTVRVGDGEASLECFSADGQAIVLRERRMVAGPADYRGPVRFALRTVVVRVAGGEKLLDVPDYAWVSGDRKTLVRRGDVDGEACVYDLSTGLEVGQIPAVGPVAMSKGTGLMAACTGVSEGLRMFDVWDLRAMTRLATSRVPEDTWYCRALSPDGRTLALKRGCGLRLCVMDMKRNTKLLELACAGRQGERTDLGDQIVFSPDGARMATAYEGSLLVVDVEALRAAGSAADVAPP
jgi:WD40 repeat protein